MEKFSVWSIKCKKQIKHFISLNESLSVETIQTDRFQPPDTDKLIITVTDGVIHVLKQYA